MKVRSLLKDLKTSFLNGEIQPKICQYGQHWVLNLSISFRQAIFFYKMKNFCPNIRWAGWSMASIDYFVILQILRICRQLWNSDNGALTGLRSYNLHRNCIVECSNVPRFLVWHPLLQLLPKMHKYLNLFNLKID